MGHKNWSIKPSTSNTCTTYLSPSRQSLHHFLPSSPCQSHQTPWPNSLYSTNTLRTFTLQGILISCPSSWKAVHPPTYSSSLYLNVTFSMRPSLTTLYKIKSLRPELILHLIFHQSTCHYLTGPCMCFVYCLPTFYYLNPIWTDFIYCYTLWATRKEPVTQQMFNKCSLSESMVAYGWWEERYKEVEEKHLLLPK